MNPSRQNNTVRRSILRKSAFLVIVGLIGYGIWLINDEYDILPWELSQSTIDAWKRAGFEFSYMAPNEAGNLRISTSDTAGALPTFTCIVNHRPLHSQVEFAKLPAPRVPFRLHWHASGMNVNGLKLLTRFTKLTALNVDFSQVTDDGLKEIASLKKLTHLSLKGTRITGAGLMHLAPLSRLKMIDLSYTAVIGSGLKDLAGLKKLTRIVLTQEQLTDETVANLRQMGLLHSLPGAKTSDHKLPMKAEEVVSLDLRKSKMTDAGLTELAPLKNLTLLELEDRSNSTEWRFTDKTLSNLREIRLLHALQYCKNYEVKKSYNIEQLGELTHTRIYSNINEMHKRPTKPEEVVSFALPQCEVTDAGLKELAYFTNLTYLDLSQTKVTDVGLKELAPLKNLTTIELNETQMTDVSLRVLREIGLLHALLPPSLKGKASRGKPPTKSEDVVSLDLSGTKVTVAGLKELAPLKNLTKLELSEYQVTNASLKVLHEIRLLHALNLNKLRSDGNQLTDARLKVLREVGLLHAMSTATTAAGKRPNRTEDVINLNLQDTAVTDAGLKELAPLKNLTKLELCSKHLTDTSLKVLREIRLLHALTEATTTDGKRPTKPEDVTKIDLYVTQVTGYGLKELAPFKSLNTLGLHHTQLTDTGMQVLREIGFLHTISRATNAAGKRPTTSDDVTKIDLQDTPLTDVCLNEIATLNNLKMLYLQNTNVTDAGLKQLARFENLTTLYLTGSKVTASGVAELQKALPKCYISR